VIDSHVPHDAPLIVAGDFNDWMGQASRHFHDHLDLQEVYRQTQDGMHVHFLPGYPCCRWTFEFIIVA
jgi:endonuclease/exonuclease/phosphatase family metal-dependent hydrolase